MRDRNLTLAAGTVFCATVLLGAFCSLVSWNGVIYVYVGESRTPAAIQKNRDVSNLRGADFRIASRDRLLSDAKLLSEGNMVGIQLGHFITKKVDGSKQFACQAYQRIRLIYQAEGMAESGEIPEMTIEGACQMSRDNINAIAPLWVPRQKLFSQRPHNFEVEYEENDARMLFRFDHMGSQWPQQWILQTVTLFDPDTVKNSLEFSASEVASLRPKQLTLLWDAQSVDRPDQRLLDPSERSPVLEHSRAADESKSKQ